MLPMNRLRTSHDGFMHYGGGVFFLACEDFRRMFHHSFPGPAFFFFFKVEISLRTLILYARISPQWLSELRRLWPNVP